MEYLRGGELYDIIADAKFFSEEVRAVDASVSYLGRTATSLRGLSISCSPVLTTIASPLRALVYLRTLLSSVFLVQNARDAIRDVLNGVAYLHSRGIAHRDLKPENLLCMNKEFPLRVKVSDFGLSNFLDSDKESRMMRTVCGSLNYIAPEMLRADGYGPEVGKGKETLRVSSHLDRG